MSQTLLSQDVLPRRETLLGEAVGGRHQATRANLVSHSHSNLGGGNASMCVIIARGKFGSLIQSFVADIRTATVFVPLVCFAPVQIRVKSFDHLNVAVFGLLFSLINAAAFQGTVQHRALQRAQLIGFSAVFIKWLIGGLRPHFLSVCNPVINTATVGTGFQSIMYTRAVCTGNKKDINDVSVSSLADPPKIEHTAEAWHHV